MMHKIAQLEEVVRGYIDHRQADADQFVEWGQADYYDAERDGGVRSAAEENLDARKNSA